MSQLYLTPIPDADARRDGSNVASAIQQAGLLEQSGVATENIATDSISITVEGQYRFGSLLSQKAATEINSLSESAYVSLPFFNPENAAYAQRGYYEVESGDTTDAKPGVGHIVEYTLKLNKAGTRENSRRAVRTNLADVNTISSINTASIAIAIPDAATSVRWYDEADGLEAATVNSTVEAEFGTVAQYDPDEPSFDNPTLTYDLAYADDGPTDVRVFDSRDRLKFAPTADGDVNTWVHIYDTTHQFAGAAVIDTGLFRLILGGDLQSVFDLGDTRTVAAGTTDTIPAGTTETDGALVVEDTGTFVVEDTATHILTGDAPTLRTDFAAARYDDTDDEWRNVTLDTGTAWSLAEWSFTRVRPARVELATRWTDGTDTQRLTITLNRGQDDMRVTVPDNETNPPSAIKDILVPVLRNESRTASEVQGLIDRDEIS